MNHQAIFNQLVVNFIIDSRDIQEYIKSFLFYDHLQVLAIQNKKSLIYSFQRGLHFDYFIDTFGNSHWTLSYRYERMISSVNCSFCGNYKYLHLPNSITCSCYHNYYHHHNQPLTLFL